ncbi:MAG: TIGR00730 family Rossman fold protein [Nitrospinota bacterium]
MSKKLKNTEELLTELADIFPDELSEKEAARLHSIFSEFVAGFRLMLDKGPLVTVFGSSRINSDSPLYTLGMDLGGRLAKNGFAVVTGGGPGLMEAVNRGAKEENGTSLGINITIPDEQKANIYASPSITIDHFFVRKVLLLKYSSAYLFLPGGFGTLDELFETITLMQTKKIEPFPLVLLRSEFWEGLLDWLRTRLKREGYINGGDMNYISIADSVEEAIEIINKSEPHIK